MVMELYDSLLDEFSKVINIPDLKPDSNNSCMIVLPNKTKIQLEIDSTGQFLVLGSVLGFVPAGRYRENLLREALRGNDLPHPRYGNFAYSKKNDTLVLFLMLPLINLTGSKIADHFTPFSEKATTWKEAIEKGETPSLLGNYTSRSGGGMFGL